METVLFILSFFHVLSRHCVPGAEESEIEIYNFLSPRRLQSGNRDRHTSWQLEFLGSLSQWLNNFIQPGRSRQPHHKGTNQLEVTTSFEFQPLLTKKKKKERKILAVPSSFGDLNSRCRDEREPPAVEVLSINHWTTGKTPATSYLDMNFTHTVFRDCAGRARFQVRCSQSPSTLKLQITL